MSARTPVVIERTYPVAPERVYEAWIDVDVLTRWWGCAVDTLWNVHEWNVEPGGEVRVSQTFDGNHFEVRGRFVEVESPTRLAFDWDAGQRIVVQITAAEDTSGGAVMRIEHHGLPDEAMEQVVTEGWGASLVQIGEILT